jgi:hypothetical protein
MAPAGELHEAVEVVPQGVERTFERVPKVALDLVASLGREAGTGGEGGAGDEASHELVIPRQERRRGGTTARRAERRVRGCGWAGWRALGVGEGLGGRGGPIVGCCCLLLERVDRLALVVLIAAEVVTTNRGEEHQ